MITSKVSDLLFGETNRLVTSETKSNKWKIVINIFLNEVVLIGIGWPVNKQDGVAKMVVILTGSNYNNGKSLKELCWKYFILIETYFLICCKSAGIYLFSLAVFFSILFLQGICLLSFQKRIMHTYACGKTKQTS